METTSETIVISGTKEATEAIRKEIDAQPGSKTSLTSRKNLDGNVAAWIVIANLAAQALPHILGFIKDSLGMRQVKKIKWRDMEIENPTPEDVQRFRALIEANLEVKGDSNE